MTRSPVDGAVAPSASAREVDEFLEIVLADDALVAAEFDEIVAHSWGGERSPTAPSTRRDVPGPAPAAASAEPGAVPRPGPVHPPVPRVRSPPR